MIRGKQITGDDSTGGEPESHSLETAESTGFERLVLERIKNGEVDAFELLVEKYKKQIFSVVGRFVGSESIAEVSQLAFIKIFQSLSGYRAEAPFGHWATKVTVRACYDYWRGERKKKELTLSEEHFELLDASLSTEHFYTAERERQTKELLQWSLNQMAPADKMVLVLFYLEGYSEKEVAEMLEWSVAKVKIQAFRAKKKLKKLLERTIEEKLV